MQVVSLVLGILSLLGMAVAFMPCFGALNWLNIPFSILTVVVAAIARKPGQDNTLATSGLVCGVIAAVLGTIRLVLGGGIL